MKHTLHDGRTLGYAEYGDPNGEPVFFIHGSPGSRLFHPPDEVTKRLGMRLICAERPGYGDSTFQPNRSILDWPNDIASLADALKFDTFTVLVTLEVVRTRSPARTPCPSASKPPGSLRAQVQLIHPVRQEV